MGRDDDDETIILRRPPATAARSPFAAIAAAAPYLAPLLGSNVRRGIEAIVAELDRKLNDGLDAVLHHPEFQRLEASWRALRLLLASVETGSTLKIRVLDISKRELARNLRKFRGTAWDDSPVFRRIYEDEYGQLGGEPFGLLVGDYEFDNRAEDVHLLGDIASIAAAAHAPFVAAASPALLQMEDWAEIADRRELSRVFALPEYAAWRALRASEDSRYLALCLPRFLVRLPYGGRDDPQDRLDFEERCDGPDRRRFLWANASWLFAVVVARAFERHGWCARITGIENGGLVEDLPVLRFATADGAVDRRCSLEVAISEGREAELSRMGLVSLLHLKGSQGAAFMSAPSLQQPATFDDRAATLNASISAKLPYLFACCRFAHFIKCMVRDKTGGGMTREQLQAWLGRWLQSYVDNAPATSSEEWRARRPLADADMTLEPHPHMPGQYQAVFSVRPHFQLEGATASLRLLTRLATR